MARTLYFATHSTSLDNEAGLASGHSDVALSPTGEVQARTMGEHYRNVGLIAVFASDLQRSYRTAELAFAPDLPIIRDARLRECDYGELTRRSSHQIESERVLRVTKPFPGGESFADATRRVGAFINDLRARPEAGPWLVVGHRATQYAFEHLLRRIPLEQAVLAPWEWQPGWTYELESEE